MDKNSAKIIIKHIIQDAFEEMFDNGLEIETESELLLCIDELTEKVLEKEYELKFSYL